MPTLTITEDEFRTLPEDCQKALLACFLPDVDLDATDVGQPSARGRDEDEEPSDLSVKQAQKTFSSFSDRTKEIVRWIVTRPASGFELLDLEKNFEVQANGLKGSWTGITKVTRRVLGDDEARLIWWTENEDGKWRGRLSPMTHRSFRRVLGLN